MYLDIVISNIFNLNKHFFFFRFFFEKLIFKKLYWFVKQINRENNDHKNSNIICDFLPPTEG